MATVGHELNVCGNCLVIVANDDWTGTPEPRMTPGDIQGHYCWDCKCVVILFDGDTHNCIEDRIRAALDEYGYLVPSCDEDCDSHGFSWMDCDLCGQTGNATHKVTELID